MYDRSLFGKLSKCAWNVTSAFLKSAVPRDDAVRGASIAIQTYGDFLHLNPHLHAVVTDGCFLSDDSFVGAPGFHAEDLEEAFQYEVFKMLKKQGRINDAIIENMLSWRHLNLWDVRNHDPPFESDPHIAELVCDGSDSQIPPYDYWD